MRGADGPTASWTGAAMTVAGASVCARVFATVSASVLFLCLTARNSLSNCSQVDFNLFAYASVSSPSCKSNGDIFVPFIPSEPFAFESFVDSPPYNRTMALRTSGSKR